MIAHSNSDRELFQTLLASAFAVQESGINTRLLSVLVEVQELIAKGGPDFAEILDLIANRARTVAGAAGILIGLLRANQLVYLAGSGSAAKYVGRFVAAVISVSARKGARKEILRVESAETDARIEGAICRQRGAKALLIIPIYRESTVAGVMEVWFSDAHIFPEPEMHTYRVMARMVEEAILRDIQLSQKRAPATQPPKDPHPIERPTSQRQDFCSEHTPASKPWIAQVRRGVAAEVPGKVPALRLPAKDATAIIEPVRRTLHELHLDVAVAVVAIALGLAGWIAFDHYRSPTTKDSARTRSNAFSQHVFQATAKPSPASRASKPHIAPGGAESTKAARSLFKRVRVGPHEVDYITEDVTIRHFTTTATPSHVRGANQQFAIGDDVTVRYFAYKPQIGAKTLPASAATQSTESSMPKSK
jgi:GAF domain